VTFVATEYQYEGPASIPAGLTEVQLVNKGQSSHGLVIVGLDEGRTTQDIVDILDDEGPIPSWVTFSGGVGGIPAGTSASVVHDLTPGQYAVFSFETGDDGIPDAAKGMIQDLEVSAAVPSAAEAPAADVTMHMLDFNYATSGALKSGPQVIAVTNAGAQPHEALIMKLGEGMTGADVVKMITEFSAAGATPEGGAPEAATPAGGATEGTPAEAAPPAGPPFASAGGLAPIDPGESAFIKTDLAPGNYMFICFIPDTTDGTMHLAKGMYQEFSVE
jgi:hypothetical protein